MRRFAVLIVMLVLSCAFTMSAFADTASSTVSASESASNAPTPSPAPDEELGSGLKEHFSSGVGDVSSTADGALDDLANVDFGDYGSFMGQILVGIPSEIWAAILLMLLCMIVRVAVGILAG